MAGVSQVGIVSLLGYPRQGQVHFEVYLGGVPLVFGLLPTFFRCQAPFLTIGPYLYIKIIQNVTLAILEQCMKINKSTRIWPF